MNKKMKKLLIKTGVWAAVLAIAAVAGYFILFHNADVLKIEEKPLLPAGSEDSGDIRDAAWEEASAVEKKIVGLKPTWLTAHSDPADKDAPYYKLADITAPRNYSAVKNAEDLDGDSLTTQFIYKGKTAKNPGQFQVQGKHITDEELAALLQNAQASDWQAPVSFALAEETEKEDAAEHPAAPWGFFGKLAALLGIAPSSDQQPSEEAKGAEEAAEPPIPAWGWIEIGKEGAEKQICIYPLGGKDTTQAVCLVPTDYADLYVEILITMDACAEMNTWLELAELMAGKVTPGKQLHPFVADFKLNFIDEDRWQFLTEGLGITLLITLFATILGIIIGVVVAGVCSTWDKNSDRMHSGLGKWALMLGNKICRLFLTVIRGTPVVIQLMLFYFVILVSVQDWNLGFLGTVKSGVIVAIIAFGINSGAYVAEIIRGGIMSIDRGQFEAGRSLGFNYLQTMRHIIIPQALKNVLPSLANEFIVLLKETSVAGYVAVVDLTKGGDIIRGVTYSPFLPLIAVAVIYLILVVFFTWLVGKLERRLRNSEH